MVLIIFATLLILGIAFYQTVRGCFSAMIMAILTVLCAAAAMNYYEPLAGLLADRLGACAAPAALTAVFVLPLLVLRILFDRFIRGNVVLGLWPDRLGGAVFGFVTGMILTGMFMIIFQMLPMPASIIGWRTYDSALGVKDGGPPTWATNFTLATVGRLSDGPLRAITSPKKFRVSHDDLPLESFCLRNRPTGARASTPSDALDVTGAYVVEIPEKERFAKLHAELRAMLHRTIPVIKDSTPPYPLLSLAEAEDTKVLVIRVRVDESARNEKDNWWRLPATHFRLVCESGRSFYPVGYLTYAADWRVAPTVSDKEKEIKQIGDILVARQWQSKGGPAKLIVDWLYRIPTSEKASYVVFRRTAIASLPPVIKGLPKVFDKDKYTQLALSVKPVIGRAVLKPVGTRRKPFNPEFVEVKGQLPDGIWIRYKDEARPAPIKQIESTGGKLQNVLIDGAVSELAPSKDRNARHITGLYMPGRDNILMQVQCGVDREFRGASIIKNLRPHLLLNTDRSVPHKGAYLFYNVGGKKQVYFYYDFQASKSHIDPEFAQRFRDNLAEAETFGLIFSVPASENGSVVGLTFLGVGHAYEFHTVMPLACTRKR